MYEIKKKNNQYQLYINNKLYKEYKKEDKNSVLTDLIVFSNHLLRAKITKDKFILYNIAVIKDEYKLFDKNKVKLLINEKSFECEFITFIRKRKYIFLIYKIYIPFDKVLDFNIHNKLVFSGTDKKGYGFRKRLSYHVYNFRNGKFKLSKLKVLNNKNTAIYLRQSTKNSIYLTNRQINITDSKKERRKLFFAWLLSKIFVKKIIILYEKECRKYEESASVLYEKLIDMGYKNVYYILDRKNYLELKIRDKYRKNIVIKNTFKHYLYFFSAKTLMGTESPAHAIELRISYKKAVCRIYGNKFNYIFLQHGVMYMISLDSHGRSFFRKDGIMPKKAKIVVSSKAEANHFIELGGYELRDLYVCGLPKFDKNVRNKKHDKIVIMSTWRPWEFNLLRDKPYETGYYKFIMNIIKNIPKNLIENVIILPHPLIIDAFKETDLKKYMVENITYDEILKEADVIITDYSSIVYDAFYRGSNVIFCWKDRDECMKKYGGHLLLNDNNVFGDVCYSYNEIKDLILKNYEKKQLEKYKKRYEKIVEFHDNKNTDRLIMMLKKDKII